MTGIDGNETAGTVGQEQRLPVIEERLRVEKRQVESGRARVHVTVSEHDQAVETLLRRQDISVERVSIGREVESAPPTRHEGNTIIIPVMEEIVVTEKRLVLKEELRIRINETVQTDTQVVRLRREHAEVELDGNAADVSSQRSDA